MMEGEITFSRNPVQSIRGAAAIQSQHKKGPAKLPARTWFSRFRCPDQFVGAVGIAGGGAFLGAPFASLKKRKNCEFGEITRVVSCDVSAVE